MKSKWLTSVFITVFLLLIAVIDYPFVMRLIFKREQTAVVIEYEDKMKEMEQSEQDQYLEQARLYNQILASEISQGLTDAFEGSESQSAIYEQMFGVPEQQVIAAVEIPIIDVLLPVYYGTAEETLRFGAGLLEGTSLPVGGTDTHACIAAHRGLLTKRMFTDLDQLKEGDLFFIHTIGKTLAYQVEKTEVVEPEVTESLQVETGRDQVTLITCTPYGVNSHRIYVHGIRIPYEQSEETDRTIISGNSWRDYWWIVLTIILLGWMFFVLYWRKRQFMNRSNTRRTGQKGER